MGVITTDKADTNRIKKNYMNSILLANLKIQVKWNIYLKKQLTITGSKKKKKNTRNISEFITIKKIDPAVKNLTSNKSSSPDGCTGTF